MVVVGKGHAFCFKQLALNAGATKNEAFAQAAVLEEHAMTWDVFKSRAG